MIESMTDTAAVSCEPTDPAADEARLVAALRCGDEAAFVELIEAYQPAMLRLAMVYVPGRAVAEEVVQETWLGVLQGLDRFEGRSSLKTWIFRILTNRARTRGAREGRSIPFSEVSATDADEPSVDPGYFLPADHERWPGHWASSPGSPLPEAQLLSQEVLAQIEAAIEALPPQQRLVIQLRDVAGCSADTVCQMLDVSEVNQRVLLHRARAKVRHALAPYLELT